LLARQFDEMWRALGAPARIALVELGPGRGWFAQDVLDWSRKKFPDFLDAVEYVLVERSRSLRLRLRQRFAGRKENISIVGSLEEWPRTSGDTIVFANEFFDALPVEVIGATPAEGELRIAVVGGQLVETFVPPSRPVLEFLDRYGTHPRLGDRSEAALAAVAYMRNLAGRLSRGFIVAVDYGYTREELLAGRSGNTLRAFRQHAFSSTPYESPGEEDITASVNFTALRAAAVEAGMEAGDLVTQAEFLVGIGEANQFADAFEDAELPRKRAKIALQLKHLVTPAGMGEIYQVLVLRRGVEREKALNLSGLRYARR